MRWNGSGAVVALLASLAGSDARAQANFTNFETPQTHPIEVVTVGGAEHVLVCNTPDNSLEVWTATSAPTFRLRVGVGLGPGTVRWNPTLSRAFVCNFDGDSVSIIQFQGSGASLSATLLRTSEVGDEPADITFNPSSTVALVTLSARGLIQRVNPTTLAPVGSAMRLDTNFNANNNPTFPVANPPLALAVKMPRAAAWLPATGGGLPERLFILNFIGGQRAGTGSQQFVDVDLWRMNTPSFSGTIANGDYIGEVGTTNHAFAVDSSGTRMFVVGTRAQNLAAIQMSNVRDVLTGFVQSWLSVIEISPSTGAMSLRPEAGTGVPAFPGFPAFPSLNLNRNYSGTNPPVQEVAPDVAIAQPTDIDLFESGGNVTRIAIAGFHSDTLALLTPLPNNTSTPGGYSSNRVPFTPTSNYSAVGPRGLAFNAAGTLLFTNGRLDNTLRVVNTSTLAVTTLQMQQDPTPAEIRQGRQFLYSTRFSRAVQGASPRGFVSCASCHVDGRTDALPWDLSDSVVVPGVTIPPTLLEANLMSTFPNPKNVMITQTLQGLINFPTNESFQFASTNAPYHWRGDKFDSATADAFSKFNEAFVNLQRMPPRPMPPALEVEGIPPTDMIGYRRFINTIRHPPNPEQALERIVTGYLKDPVTGGALPPNKANPGGNGSVLGREMFVNAGGVACGTCVSCHSLPDGSSNTITQVNSGQPVEPAALRNLLAREGQMHASHFPDPVLTVPTGPSLSFPGSVLTSNRGLTHDGTAAGTLQSSSISMFATSLVFYAGMPAFQPGGLPGATPAQLALARDQIGGLVQFVRELDTGIAPLAGHAYTVNNALSPVDSGQNAVEFARLEEQVRQGNVGFGVRAQASNGVIRGFWFDPTVLPAGVYRDAAAPLSASLDRASLLATWGGPGNVMVAQGTPLGTERRWANPVGVAVLISDPTNAPANIDLEPMAPNTFYEGLTNLNRAIAGAPPTGTTAWRIERFHAGLSLAPFRGVPGARRHEPPRRFRVSGTNIRHGARLYLFIRDPTPSGVNGWHPVGMDMVLVPTRFTGLGGRPIWETEMELDQLQTYALLNGAWFAPGVMDVMNAAFGTTPTLPPLQAATFNDYRVIVLNEDGSVSSLNPASDVLEVRDTR